MPEISADAEVVIAALSNRIALVERERAILIAQLDNASKQIADLNEPKALAESESA